MGFITRGHGVSVHRTDCPNVKELSKSSDRLIEVSWRPGKPTSFLVSIQVEALDRRKLSMHRALTTYPDLKQRADELIGRFGLSAVSGETAANLSYGDQRKLEVAILIALEPDIFMFDEPTAGMSIDEVPVILDLIQHIKAQGDKTILLVEHKMDVVRSLADRIIVLHNGALVADGEPAAVIASPVVQQAYLGLAAEDAVEA